MWGDQGWPHMTCSCTELRAEPSTDSFPLLTSNVAAAEPLIRSPSGSMGGQLLPRAGQMGDRPGARAEWDVDSNVFDGFSRHWPQGEGLLPWLHTPFSLFQKAYQGRFFFQRSAP